MKERELERTHQHVDSADENLVAPGRANTSSQLQRSERPITSGLIMRKASSGAMHDDAASAIDAAAAGSGHALPDDLRGRFESSLGTDLSGVRLHTGGDSAAAASAVGARAYAVGNDIHFGANQYDPHSSDGQRLIAHEVAHTVQQRGASPSPQYKLAVSSAGDACEVDADRAADAMVSGAPASVGGASVALMRKEEEGEEGEKKKPRYPSWKGEKISKPFGKYGSFNVTYGDKPSAKVSFGNKAKTTLIEKKYTQQIQIAPGIIGVVTGGVGVEAEASGKVEAGGEWFQPKDSEEMAASWSLAGKGEVSISAKGSLQLSVGAGVAGILGVTGGIEAELEAKASASIGVGIGNLKNPDGSDLGTGMLTVALGAELGATANLKVDVVTPADPINVYSHELGKLTLAQAKVVCTALYANGNVTDLPAATTFEILPLPNMEARQHRPLNDKEKAQYHPKNETEDGASGNHGGVGPEPESVPMSDEELLAGGKAQAAKALGAAASVELPVKALGKSINGAIPVSVVVDGVAVGGLCYVSPKQTVLFKERGKEVTSVHKGVIENWSLGYFNEADLVKSSAKNTSAIAHAILRNHITLSVAGTDFEFKDVPIGPCLKDDPAGHPAPLPPAPYDGPVVKPG